MKSSRAQSWVNWVPSRFALAKAENPSITACSQGAPPSGQSNQPVAESDSAWVDVLKAVAPAIVALLGGWFVTARLSPQWEARKKRAELDITLARDFYKLVASFKAIAREAGALGERPLMSPQDRDTRRTTMLSRGDTVDATTLGRRPRQTPERVGQVVCGPAAARDDGRGRPRVARQRGEGDLGYGGTESHPPGREERAGSTGRYTGKSPFKK
jgi:hypothetical protein